MADGARKTRVKVKFVSFLRLIFSWTGSLIRRRPTRLFGTMIGVGLALALLACLGAFIDSSVRTMTSRAVAGLPIDWQILLNSHADEEAVRTAIRQADPNVAVRTVGYADVPSLEARTGDTVQTTGAAIVLGLSSDYKKAFPSEIAQMVGPDQGVFAVQQAAANLHVSVGDLVTIQRAGGLAPVEVRINGIINLPDASTILQRIPSAASPQAPPDNVLVLPVEIWHYLFSEQMAVQPDSVHFQVHVRSSRNNLPANPEAAYAWELQRAHHLELSTAGHGVLADNLAVKLASVRGDALYAKVLFLFLGLPGLVVASLLTLGIAGSGAVRRRQQQALLRTRGASVGMVLNLASAEAVLVGLGGGVLGSALALAVSKLFKVALGISLTGMVGWLFAAFCVGLVLALIAVLQPAWQEARRSTVSAARILWFNRTKPLWQRAWLDAVLLAVGAVDLWWMASTGYQLVLAPEGGANVSVHYEAFAGPFCLWIGTMLGTLRLFGLMLERGLPLAGRLRVPPLIGRLSRIVAASLVRQRRALSRAMALVALAVSFAVSTAIFNATYQAQSRIDAELTNGGDVTISGIPSATIASELVSKLEKLPGVLAARTMQHGYAYVGNDLQDIYGIDPKTIGEATQLADAYFADGGAQAALKKLADQPDGVLVSDETVTDFQLNRGDQLNLRLKGVRDSVVSFRFVGVVREFPTAPKDSFLVANSAYLASHAESGLQWTILIRSNVNPSLLAPEVSRVAGSIAGLKVSDIASVQRQISSSLSAIDLRGLTVLELSFAIVFVVGATGLALFLSLAERKRSFAILSALGAKRRHLAAFMWSEAVTVLLGGGLVGICVGWLIAFVLVKVLAGAFDPPPETLTVPWIYLLFLCASAIALTALGVVLHLRKLLREPVINDLRSGV
jgi:putative ABC transport system permease protein